MSDGVKTRHRKDFERLGEWAHNRAWVEEVEDSDGKRKLRASVVLGRMRASFRGPPSIHESVTIAGVMRRYALYRRIVGDDVMEGGNWKMAHRKWMDYLEARRSEGSTFEGMLTSRNTYENGRRWSPVKSN